jgi:DNA processing protein
VFLRESVKITPAQFAGLVLKLGAPEAIWDESPDKLSKIGILSTAELGRLLKQRSHEPKLLLQLQALADAGLTVISCLDSDYPQSVLGLSYPPSFLYRQGVATRPGPQLYVSGARSADADLIALAVAIGKALSKLNVAVATTLCEGVEMAVHVGALAGEGRQAAFLPCGHRALPLELQALLARVVEAGAVYSEYAPDVQTSPAQRTEAALLAMGASQGMLCLGEGESAAAVVAEAVILGRPIFYPATVDSADAAWLRSEGAYPIAGPDGLELLLPYL